MNENSFEKNMGLYYSIVAGGVRLKLLESIIETQFFELFDAHTLISESDIIKTLKLNPLRARKWLHLLADEKFIDKVINKDELHFSLGTLGNALKSEWWQCKQMLSSWQVVAKENLIEVLSGSPVKTDVSWPPRSQEDVIFLEEWMTKTAENPINTLKKALDFKQIHNLLDVGGGDGTIACALAELNPNTKFTIYNIPFAALLAKKKIEQMGLNQQINVIEGDFIKESNLPSGYDFILFCRVLWDWSLETNQKLLKMAYDALEPGGYIGICEAFKENHREFTLAFEFRYIFWNDFETAVFKTSDDYIQLLKKVGFQKISLLTLDDKSSFSLLVAEK